MGLLNSLKELGTLAKDAGKYLISEFITNKDTSKGILDYDKRQGYKKQLENPYITPDDAEFIKTKMSSEGVIDKAKYDSAQEATYKAQKETVKEEKPSADGQVMEFTEGLSKDLKDNYIKGDKYQRDIIEKAISEQTKEFQMTAQAVQDTYNEFKDEQLIKKREELRPEYENLIRENTKKYADYINQGYTFGQAYKKIIDENKESAKRIVQIQNQLKTEQNVAGMIGGAKNWRQDIKHGNVAKSFVDGYLTIAAAASQVGQTLIEKPVELAKEQLRGMYDGLEELNNMNIYKESIPVIDQWRTAKSRWLEGLDALPQITETLAPIGRLGKASKIDKLDNIVSGILKAGKIDRLADVTKTGRFVSDMIKDVAIYDILAAPALGRPMVSDDIYDNMIFNVPINLGLAAITRGVKASSAIPMKAINNDNISASYLNVLKDDSISTDDAAQYLYNEAKLNRGVNEKDVLAEGMNKSSIPEIQRTINSKELPEELLTKHNEIKSKAFEIDNRVRLGKTTIDDSIYHDLQEKLKANKGESVRQLTMTPEEFGKAAIERATNMKQAILGMGDSALSNKMLATSLSDLFFQGGITREGVESLIQLQPKNSVGRTLLSSMWIGDADSKQRLQSIINEIKAGRATKDISDAVEESFQQLYYDVIENVDALGIKPGAQIGKYKYIGNNVFFDVLKQKDVGQLQVLKDVKSSIVRQGTGLGNIETTVNNIERYRLGDGRINVSHIIDIKPESEYGRSLRGYVFNKSTGGTTIVKDILGKFGIRLDGDFYKGFNITATQAGLERLNDSIKSLSDKGWNVSLLTKDELNAYRVIFLPNYMQAWKSSPKKADFLSWFERVLTPRGEDYILRTTNGTEKTKKQAMSQAFEDKNFDGLEELSAQVLAEDSLIDVSNHINKTKLEQINKTGQDMSVSSILKKILEPYEGDEAYQGLVSNIINIAQTIKGYDNNIDIAKGFGEIIGTVLGDWKSNNYITEVFKNIDSEDFYRGLIGRLLYKDPVFSRIYFDELQKKYNKLSDKNTIKYFSMFNNRIDRLKQYMSEMDTGLKGNELSKLRDAIKIEYLKTSDILLKEGKFAFEESLYKFNIKALRNTPAKDLTTGLAKSTAEITTKDIDTISKYVSYKVTEKLGLKYNDIRSSIEDGINRFMSFIKSEYGKENVFFNISDDYGVFKDGDKIYVNLGAMSSSLLIKTLADEGLGFRILSTHEGKHIGLALASINKEVKGTAENSINYINELSKELEKLSGDGETMYNKYTHYLLNTDERLNSIKGIIEGEDIIDDINIDYVKRDIEELIVESVTLKEILGQDIDKGLLNKLVEVTKELEEKIRKSNIIKEEFNTITLKKKQELTNFRLPSINSAVKKSIPEQKFISSDIISGGEAIKYNSEAILKKIKGEKDFLNQEWSHLFNEVKAKTKDKTISLGGAMEIARKNIHPIFFDIGEALQKILPMEKDTLDMSNLLIDRGTLNNRIKNIDNYNIDNVVSETELSGIIKGLKERYKNGESLQSVLKEYSNKSVDEKKFILSKFKETFKSQLISDVFNKLDNEWFQGVLPDINSELIGKVVANILNEKGLYSYANIDIINKYIGTELSKYTLANIKKNPTVIVKKILAKSIDTLGLELGDITIDDVIKKLSKKELDNLGDTVYGYLLNVVNGNVAEDIGVGVAKEINKILKDKGILVEGESNFRTLGKLFKQDNEAYGAFMIEGDGISVSDIDGYLLDEYVDIQKGFSIKYNPDYLKTDESLSFVPFNSMLLLKGLSESGELKTLGKIDVKADSVKSIVKNQLSNQTQLTKSQLVKLGGIENALQSKGVKEISAKIRDKVYNFSEEVNPYSLYADILRALNEDDNIIRLTIDGEENLFKANSLWRNPVGKYILDKLEIEKISNTIKNDGSDWYTLKTFEDIHKSIFDKITPDVKGILKSPSKFNIDKGYIYNILEKNLGLKNKESYIDSFMGVSMDKEYRVVAIKPRINEYKQISEAEEQILSEGISTVWIRDGGDMTDALRNYDSIEQTRFNYMADSLPAKGINKKGEVVEGIVKRNNDGSIKFIPGELGEEPIKILEQVDTLNKKEIQRQKSIEGMDANKLIRMSDDYLSCK